MPQESGILGLRLEFVRETTRGVTPTDPAYKLYSDAVQSFDLNPQASINPRGSIGSADIQNFNAGTESHEFTVSYDLQQWFTSSGDAAYDGMFRTTGQQLPASHTVLARAVHGGDGSAGTGGYIYYVNTGALVNSVNLGGEPESGEPIVVDLNYMCEKQRAYLVDNPVSSGTLSVVSTSANDTTQTLTIEDEGAGTSEGVSLNGTTPVVTSSSFDEIGAAFLDAECEGNITIEDASANLLMTIYGSAAYNDREGDLGIPLLGSGSHGTAIGSAYETILGDTIERPGGTNLAIDGCIASGSLSVENNIEATSCIDQIGHVLSEGPRTVTLNASLFGPKISYDMMTDHLRAVENDIVWTMSGGTLTLSGAALTSLGGVTRETDQAVLTLDNTFQGKDLVIA